MIDINSSPIRQFLKDKTIFVTGGLGFCGKVLIEKLLKCEVKKIYLLARPKKGKSMQERLGSFIQDPVRTYNFIKRYTFTFSLILGFQTCPRKWK